MPIHLETEEIMDTLVCVLKSIPLTNNFTQENDTQCINNQNQPYYP